MPTILNTIQKTFLVTAIAAAAILPRAAAAQGTNCAPHAAVVEQLAQRYGESRQAAGLASNNTIIEVFASLETGTWSITVTRPGGPTCLVASGEAYRRTEEPLPPLGDPA